MNLNQLINRKTINFVSRFNVSLSSLYHFYVYRNFSTINVSATPSIYSPTLLQNPKFQFFKRYLHSAQQHKLSESSIKPKFNSNNDSEEDGTMNEFLSRFVWVMRGKLYHVYPDSDKQTIDNMLLIIVEKLVFEMEKGGLEQMTDAMMATSSQDFSEDLWRTVLEVSNSVLEDMENERKKEMMKGFLQSEEVKEMCRFAAEIGIRGDMLRELRFKWAGEKMEESEFYASLEKLREVERVQEKEKEEVDDKNAETMGEMAVMGEEGPKVISLPKRHGKIRYKIYGLDLSDPKWAEVADKIHETGEISWPQEPKPIHGKNKLVTEKILSLKEEDDPSRLLAEWVQLVEPTRIDWLTLLDKLKVKSTPLYFKVAELLLTEKSFQANIRDYSMLVDAYAEQNRLEDAERILKKMNENGIEPDILITTLLVHMYSKAGNIALAKEAYESLKNHGFQPDMKVYKSMIMAYVNAGETNDGESLMREMEARDIEPTEEIYMALLRSFSQRGDVSGASRIATTMHFARNEPSLESCTLLVEAYGKAGEPDQARKQFDHMKKVGPKPDDRAIAGMIAAYENKNLLDKALDLLLELERDGFELGPATYTVLVDWFCRLQLVDEAEHLLGKIVEQGEAPPFKIQVSLCEMYARAGIEKKALQYLGALGAKKEHLGADDFERVINGLIAGGFLADAERLHRLMEAQGFSTPDKLKVALTSSQMFRHQRPTK